MQPIRLALVLLLATGFAAAQSSPTPAAAASNATPTEPPALHSFDLKAIDKTADPCVNFYQYACGNWRKNNPIPPDQTRWGRFNQVAQRNRYLLYVDLKQAAQDPKSPLQKQYGDFFAACMDTSLVNQKGDKPLLPVLQQIDALNNKGQLGALVATLQYQDGTEAFFGFGSEQDEKNSNREIAGTYQGGLSLPDRDYYLLPDARMAKIRQQFKQYVVGMFKLIGDSDAKAQTEANSVMTIETALAKGSTPRVDLRDPDKRYHPMPVSELKTLAPNFDWTAYLSGIHAPPIESLNVATPDFFKAMNQVIESQSVGSLKSYLRFHAANSAAPWLSTPFDDAHFNFFQKTLRGQLEQTPRWKRCTMLADDDLGEAVGQDWVKQNFPPSSKANMEKLVASLKKALAEDIQQLPWMTEATKQKAELKLDAFRQKIGYPEKWRDYSKLEVKRDDLLGNVYRSDAFDFAYDLNKIGKPVNEKLWDMTPPTVNAYYKDSFNDINFPAGILQPPFYDPSKGPAVNYGAIGVVIGHEMTHGFDDEGSKYDAHGNVRNWWTPADKTAFDQRTDCEVKEYGNFSPVPGQKLNGKLTLGENTADNGGLRIAYQALMSTLAADHKSTTKKVDGYTPAQRYFISFAQVWCENVTPQAARVAARVDPHSPGKFRTNGTVQNFPEFGKAFGCHKGQPMMPDNSCRVW